jgi:hypothetical protein
MNCRRKSYIFQQRYQVHSVTSNCTFFILRNLVQEHLTNSPVALKPLSMKLNGIIDAAVMGGTAMYERAFFSGKSIQSFILSSALIYS